MIKKFSPGLWPTVMTIPVILILLSLSIWQINRYFWKVDLLDNVAQQMSEAAVPFPSGDIDLDEWGYRRVEVTGTFVHDKEIHLFAHTIKGLKGFQIITPLILSDGSGTVLVNRGWVPERFKESVTRNEGLLGGEVTLTGVIRKPWAKSYDFMPASNPETNVWLYGELEDMAAHLKLEDVKPVFVELDELAVPGGWPKGGQTRVTVPNNHVEYSLTWLALAIAMAAIYVLYGLRRGRRES
ncbi:MAG: SURF1 family protein [Sneathiella sp.]|nr:SURF1 family protein [Sneathiella sp.]